MSIETPESQLAKERFEAGERFVKNRLEPIIADKDHEIYILTDENSRLLERIARLTAERDRTDLWLSNARTDCERLAAQLASVSIERDALRADLKALAEAAVAAKDEIASPTFGAAGYANAVNVHALVSVALARPGVQAVLAERGDD